MTPLEREQEALSFRYFSFQIAKLSDGSFALFDQTTHEPIIIGGPEVLDRLPFVREFAEANHLSSRRTGAGGDKLDLDNLLGEI